MEEICSSETLVDFHVLEDITLWAVSIFWGVMLCGLAETNGRFGSQTASLFTVEELNQATTPQEADGNLFEAVRSFETSVASYQNTRRHIPEDSTRHTSCLTVRHVAASTSHNPTGLLRLYLFLIEVLMCVCVYTHTQYHMFRSMSSSSGCLHGPVPPSLNKNKY
jgi:hypothetical protein